jgi:hypothetical protein
VEVTVDQRSREGPPEDHLVEDEAHGVCDAPHRAKARGVDRQRLREPRGCQGGERRGRPGAKLGVVVPRRSASDARPVHRRSRPQDGLSVRRLAPGPARHRRDPFQEQRGGTGAALDREDARRRDAVPVQVPVHFDLAAREPAERLGDQREPAAPARSVQVLDSDHRHGPRAEAAAQRRRPDRQDVGTSTDTLAHQGLQDRMQDVARHPNFANR